MEELQRNEVYARGDLYNTSRGCTGSQQRPLTAGPWAEGDPLCPEDLMIGKARTGMPTAKFEKGQQLVKRFKAVQEAKKRRILGQVGESHLPITTEAKEVVQV
jgi:hypothetical protein